MTIKRKIVGYGYSKLVCLPKYWLEQQQLKKGDEVVMKISSNGDLILGGNQNAEIKS